MNAGNVKMFLSFNNIADQELKQDDINYLTSWCNTNLMELNVTKNLNICASLDHFQLMDFIQ